MKTNRNAIISRILKWHTIPGWLIAAATVLTFSAVTTVRGGTISVVNLPATGTDSATGITTNKHYVCAVDFGNNGSPPGNINGVKLYHYSPNATTQVTNITDPNFGGQIILTCSNSIISNFTGKLNSTSSSTQGSPNNQADGNTRLMLYDLLFVTAAAPSNTWLHQEFDNLTVGDNYSLRLYYRFWGNTVGDRLQNFYFNGEGTWQAYAGNPLDEDAGTNGVLPNGTICRGARFIEYDFTAASTNVLCYMTNLINNGSMMIEGVTLEDDSFPFAPFITYQPKAVTVGNPTVFAAQAIGTGSLTYQWYHNAVSNYSGASVITDGNGYSGSGTTTLTTTTNLLDFYFTVVTNNYGSVTSSIAQINPVPTIVTQPSTTNMGNTNVVYSMAAGGFPPLAYEWFHNAVSNTSGATQIITDGNGYSGSSTASLGSATNLADFYFVIVTNAYGSVTSSITAYNPKPFVVAQPSPFKVGSSVGFNMTAGGWPNLGYQWYINTVSNTSGATAMTDGGGVSGSTTASVTVNNLLDYYFVVVTNQYGSVTSQVSVVAVPPTVVSAGEPIWNVTSQTNVIVTFSDILDPATATTAGNYALSGASVLSAAIGGSNEVILTTSVLTPSTPYTLTVQNVNDYFGITMSPNPTNVSVGVYPANLALWVRADTGVTTDAGTNTVNGWTDMSGNNNNLSGNSIVAPEPQLATNAQGDTVIRFTGTNGTLMFANPASSLGIVGNISIIAVVNFATLDGGTNGEIVSKTGSGSSDNLPAPFDYYVVDTNSSRLYRGNGAQFGQVTASSGPSIGTPHIVAVSETGNTVSHFLDGQAAGTGILNNGFNESSSTDANQLLFIGTRADNINRLSGDLSELIIAGSAMSAADIALMDSYLAQKHNLVLVNTHPTNIVSTLSGNQLTLSWPADHTGWRLQAQTNGLSVGLSTNWVTVPNSSTTNQVIMTVNPTNGCVFYRMVYP